MWLISYSSFSEPPDEEALSTLADRAATETSKPPTLPPSTLPAPRSTAETQPSPIQGDAEDLEDNAQEAQAYFHIMISSKIAVEDYVIRKMNIRELADFAGGGLSTEVDSYDFDFYVFGFSTYDMISVNLFVPGFSVPEYPWPMAEEPTKEAEVNKDGPLRWVLVYISAETGDFHGLRPLFEDEDRFPNLSTLLDSGIPLE